MQEKNQKDEQHPFEWYGAHSHGWCRSKAEAKTAAALDACGFNFVYEQPIISPVFDGGIYSPDFLLPEQGIYIEAGGEADSNTDFWDEHHVKQVSALIKLKRARRNIGNFDRARPWILSVDSWGGIHDVLPSGEKVAWSDSRVELFKCATCGKWHFARTDGVTFCPFCETNSHVKLPTGFYHTKKLHEILKWMEVNNGQ